MNIRKFFLSLLVTILICAVGFCAFVLFSSDTNVKEALDTSVSEKTNILVSGVDKDGTRSDVNMLFCIDAKEKTINIMSVPRDTRVKYGSRSYGKINACMGKTGGEELLIEKVRELTGMPVHNFCKVSFEGLRNIIDILGGVVFDVPVDMNYDDPVQDLHIHLKKGKQVLNGEEAEGLLRFRKGYATGDLGRIDVQQAFIKEMISQKLHIRYIFRAIPVINELNESVDTDMSVVYALKLALSLRDSNNIKMNTYVLPGAPKTIGGASYYICNESETEKLVKDVFGYMDGKEVSKDVSINEKVID
ncbi:MAG: LCP family protein [Clostridia bacterium]|nr:LCP family protein [Clostridia bacterium]